MPATEEGLCTHRTRMCIARSRAKNIIVKVSGAVRVCVWAPAREFETRSCSRSCSRILACSLESSGGSAGAGERGRQVFFLLRWRRSRGVRQSGNIVVFFSPPKHSIFWFTWGEEAHSAIFRSTARAHTLSCAHMRTIADAGMEDGHICLRISFRVDPTWSASSSAAVAWLSRDSLRAHPR